MKTFDEFFMEEKLDAEDREKIKEDDWGVIIKDKDGNITEKAYPMPDAQHVISAARMYPFAKRKYDAKVVAELRRKIIAKAKEYNVPDSRIQSVIDDTPGGKSKPVKEYKESVIYEEFVNGCNQIFLEGNKTQYQRTMNRWNYDPTTGTIKTDIPDPRSTTGETMRVKLVVDNTRGPFIRIPRDANGNRLYDKAEIHVPRKVLKSKGWNVDTIMKHEEGHMAAKINRDQYSDDFNKAQQQIDANKHALMGNAHGNNPEEYVVDKYAAQHSRFGKRGAIKALQRTYNEVAKSSKISSKQINAMELLTEELRQHKISVNEYYKKQMDLLRECQETLSVREGNLRALQKALVSERNDPKTVAYCNERINAVNSDIARLKTELENGCKEFDSDNEKFLSDPNTYNMLIDRVNARCKKMKIYDRDAKIKEGQLRVAFLQNNVQESVGPEDTSGTSEFDESIDNDPDDCYTEAYDAITGEEIPIDHAYTMDEMREITLSFTEDVKPGKLMKVSPPDSKYVYFGSPENQMPEIKLDRPLFVTPYKSIASIFIWRDMELQNRIPRGSYNCQYEEWLKFNKKESGRCLKDVHVYVEGYPDLEPYEIKQTGYVHQILTHNWNDNYYRYPWMDASKEWLIVNDNGNVEFDDVTECEITYHISGKPGFDKLGPRQDALESFVRKSIKLIHGKYKKDQKDPVGNQNCLLCTWCFEARMRGLDVLPRPVYSPRDDVLDIPGNQIVFGSRQIKLKNYTDLASEITKAGDGCRFYTHVNWKDSKGGHEFIIMRIGGKNFIIDPQQGEIEPLTKSHNYVSDINYDNSYIVQLSGKKFNRNLFDKWNNSGPLLWDPEKDIPYMLKEGMITKEEADKELNKPIQESALPKRIRFRPATESDIPNIRKWKLESINQSVRNKPSVLKFIEKDCYDNLKNTKMILDGKDVIGMLEACYIDDGEWWYIGEIYIDEAHRGKGIGTSILKQEIKRHDRLILRVAKDNQKAIKLYRSLGFTISKDEKFSWIMTLDKSKPVQEGVIQNIKNKVSPFEKNLVYHISPEGHLDGQIFKPRVPDYLDKYDPSKTEFEDVETPRVCFSPSIEGCLNAIIVNIGRWKTANKLRDWYVYIPEKPLKEYKYRTNKQLVDAKLVYDANITKEIWIEEPVRLKQYGIIRIDSVTDKSRKKAVPTTLGEAKKRNVYDFKWHWLVKPKVLKDVPYDYSPLEVCKDMVADLESYKYGIPENGRIVGGSEHDYDTKWKLQSPEEFEKNGGGICYDFVEFEEGYLDAYGIKCKKYFMSTDLPGHDTHTFVLVEDGKGGFIYPESSFEKVAGTHEVKSIEEAFKIVANGYWKFNDNINKVNEFKYYVWEFTGHPKYGSSIQKCIEYYSKGEPIFESNCLKPGKSQPIREFVTHFRNT